MPKPYPVEFKRDVVTAARLGNLSGPGVATDYGNAEGTVHRGLLCGLDALTMMYPLIRDLPAQGDR